MEVTKLRLEGLKLIKPRVYRDTRGYFLETFTPSLYQELGLEGAFVQDNHSSSHQGCLRGMHYQSHPGQAKLVRAAIGKIYDVAVDIRPNSPTFGQWEAVILDGELHHQLFIPIGFAHGFCVLSEGAHVLYKVSSLYDPKTEEGFRWDDPTINIEWPIVQPIVSDRDQQAPFFSKKEQFQ